MRRKISMALAVSVVTAVAVLAPVLAAKPFIVVQSTTSTQNSGLFEHILPMFTASSGVAVRVVAVGTGQAIKNARNGDGDVLLVHARQAEQKFIADGDGVKRHDVMYNDFVIVGPPEDRAGLSGIGDIKVALAKIAAGKTRFVSRGDDSGTHKKELQLWNNAGINPHADNGAWYRETGSGMGATLNVAVAMGAYTMTDRATWIAFMNKADFKVHVEGDPQLFNQYGVILVNQKRHPHIKATLGQRFIDWLVSPAGQQAIASYKRNDQQLFYPNSQS